MYNAIIFDVDGVLVDSTEANYIFNNEAYVKGGGVPDSFENFLADRGMTLRGRLAKKTGLTGEALEKLHTEVNLTPRRIDLYKAPVDITGVLERLKEKYLLGIFTNRTVFGLENYFAFANNKDLFSITLTSEHITNPKPHPEGLLKIASEIGVFPPDILYVGDTTIDEECAKAAGADFKHFFALKDNFRQAFSEFLD